MINITTICNRLTAGGQDLTQESINVVHACFKKVARIVDILFT